MHRLRVVLPVAALALALSGCSATVSLDPAPAANDPACAEVLVQLPGTLAGQDRRWTDAQATAAWGSDGQSSAVLLTCGLEAPGPSELPCQSVRGVDWIIDSADAPNYRVTSFGREPAVQVYLDNRQVSSNDVLDRLSLAVSTLPTTGSVCTPRPS